MKFNPETGELRDNKFCSNCGILLEQSANFCSNCGEKLNNSIQNTTTLNKEPSFEDTVEFIHNMIMNNFGVHTYRKDVWFCRIKEFKINKTQIMIEDELTVFDNKYKTGACKRNKCCKSSVNIKDLADITSLKGSLPEKKDKLFDNKDMYIIRLHSKYGNNNVFVESFELIENKKIVSYDDELEIVLYYPKDKAEEYVSKVVKAFNHLLFLVNRGQKDLF